MQSSVPVHIYQDERGRLVTLFNQGEWKEVNYIETDANVERGNHYHTRLREMVFMIEGEVQVSIEHVQTGAKREITLRQGDMITIDPYELHTFRTQSRGSWLNFLSEPFDHNNPDVFRRDAI